MSKIDTCTSTLQYPRCCWLSYLRPAGWYIMRVHLVVSVTFLWRMLNLAFLHPFHPRGPYYEISVSGWHIRRAIKPALTIVLQVYVLSVFLSFLFHCNKLVLISGSRFKEHSRLMSFWFIERNNISVIWRKLCPPGLSDLPVKTRT